MEEMTKMLMIIAVECIVVFGAMGIDLAAGLYKAKQRGEIHSSWGLKRTVGKFVSYEGSMLIASGVDILIYLCMLWKVLNIDLLHGIPVVSCLVGIYLLIVELVSLREKADDKQRHTMEQANEIIASIIDKKKLRDAFTEAIAEALTQGSNNKKRKDHYGED